VKEIIYRNTLLDVADNLGRWTRLFVEGGDTANIIGWMRAEAARIRTVVIVADKKGE